MSALIRKSDLVMQKKPARMQSLGWQVDIRSYAWSPPTDVFETGSNFVVRVELAGMNGADFQVAVNGQALIITGTRTESQECRSYHQMEIRFGEFSTSVDLPQGVDTSHVEANYADGFLTITFPKLKTY